MKSRYEKLDQRRLLEAEVWCTAPQVCMSGCIHAHIPMDSRRQELPAHCFAQKVMHRAHPPDRFGMARACFTSRRTSCYEAASDDQLSRGSQQAIPTASLLY